MLLLIHNTIKKLSHVFIRMEVRYLWEIHLITTTRRPGILWEKTKLYFNFLSFLNIVMAQKDFSAKKSSSPWNITESWKPSSCKTRNRLSCVNNIMVSDDPRNHGINNHRLPCPRICQFPHQRGYPTGLGDVLELNGGHGQTRRLKTIQICFGVFASQTTFFVKLSDDIVLSHDTGC